MGEVSELLHEILVNGSTDLTRHVANMAGVSRSSVEKQCYANVNPSVAVIKAAWLVTKDPRLKKLLEPINPETGESWELTPKINGQTPLKPDRVRGRRRVHLAEPLPGRPADSPSRTGKSATKSI